MSDILKGLIVMLVAALYLLGTYHFALKILDVRCTPNNQMQEKQT